MRLRRRRRGRGAAPGDRRDDRRAPGRPAQALRVEQPDDRVRGPGVPRQRRRGHERAGRDVHVRERARGRAAREPARRHRHRVARSRGRRRHAHRDGLQPVLLAARGRRQRDHAQLDLARCPRVLRLPRAIPVARRGPDARAARRRRSRALGVAGHVLPPQRHQGHRDPRPGDQGRRQGQHLVHLREPRRGRLRRPVHVRHPARSQRARRLRWRWSAPLPRLEPGADGDLRAARGDGAPHADARARR